MCGRTARWACLQVLVNPEPSVGRSVFPAVNAHGRDRSGCVGEDGTTLSHTAPRGCIQRRMLRVSLPTLNLLLYNKPKRTAHVCRKK